MSDTEDYELAKNNLKSILEIGSGSLNELSRIADQSQNIRAYEAIAPLVKSLADANKDLIDLQLKRKSLESKEPEQTNITNQLYITTAELLELIQGKKSNPQLLVESAIDR